MAYRYLLYSFLILVGTTTAMLAQSPGRNYVLSRTYKVIGASETTTPTSASYAGSPRQVSTQISYFDGLGQPTQQLAPYSGPAYQDLMSRTEYDNQFRPIKAHLPLAVATTNGQYVTSPDASYYNNALQVCQPTANAFTQTDYELSPLNRGGATTAPGSTTSVRQTYLVNAANSVKYYTTTGPTLYALQLGGGYYAANTLTYTETKDENDKTVQEFRNSYNQVVLKRVVLPTQNLDTYYVYGESGLLRAVLQPMFQDLSDATKYAFLYEYDSRGRLYQKQVPSAGSGVGNISTMSYDGNDRLTGMTDARGQLFYYLYDALNRQTEMGIVVSSVNQALNNTYYDTYGFASGYGSWANFTNELSLTPTQHFVSNPQTDRLSLMTGNQVRMLNEDGTLGNWQRSVIYYDNKGRPIQTVRELFGLGAGAIERVSQKLDFMGRTELTRTTQNSASFSSRIDKTFAYDQANRLSYIGHKVYEGAVLKKQYTHSVQNYNEVGQLKEKQMDDGLFKMNYLYTPRGWLCSQALGVGAIFSQSLVYDNNGNINQQTTNSYGSGQPSGTASYSYDGANRLTGYTSSGMWSGYAESGITYDKNGNLSTLNRTYATTTIDQLTYLYHGNQLHRVNDGGNNTLTEKGYPNGNGVDTNDELTYDAAGNLTGDSNQGIGAGGINYNVLNVARRVTKSGQVVKYTYDAAGAKRQVIAPSGVQTTYEGAFEYNATGTLARIGLEEGQLLRDVTGNYSVQYYLKDHLGNVRMVIKEDGSVLQRTEYYGFGLPFFKDTSSVATNKYLYNGKEQQPQTNWLDFGARMYNPGLGRWIVPDPITEDHFEMTSYSYVMNNPSNFKDFFGLDTLDSKKSGFNWDQVKPGDIVDNTKVLQSVSVTAQRLDKPTNIINDFMSMNTKKLSTVNDVLKYGVGYGVETSSSVVQIFLKATYKSRTNINTRINSKSLIKFMERYRTLGKFAGGAGRLGPFANTLTSMIDANAYKSNSISLQRLSYKLTGTGTSVYVGAVIGEVGGPYGVVAGAAIGATFDAGEWGYDTYIEPAFQQISVWDQNFNDAIRNGWLPGNY